MQYKIVLTGDFSSLRFWFRFMWIDAFVTQNAIHCYDVVQEVESLFYYEAVVEHFMSCHSVTVMISKGHEHYCH